MPPKGKSGGGSKGGKADGADGAGSSGGKQVKGGTAVKVNKTYFCALFV
jgi:hypothetical protein